MPYSHYCPNCHADLKGRIDTCWNCKAVFTGNAAWKPTDRPLGAFREFPQAVQAPPEVPAPPAKPTNPILSMLLRAILALVFYAPLTILVALMGVMGGSGSSDDSGALVVLVWVASGLGLSVWVAWPLLRFIK